MGWIFVGLLLGSVVTSSHESEEACLGRKALLEKKEVRGQCVLVSTWVSSGIFYSGGAPQQYR